MPKQSLPQDWIHCHLQFFSVAAVLAPQQSDRYAPLNLEVGFPENCPCNPATIETILQRASNVGGPRNPPQTAPLKFGSLRLESPTLRAALSQSWVTLVYGWPSWLSRRLPSKQPYGTMAAGSQDLTLELEACRRQSLQSSLLSGLQELPILGFPIPNMDIAIVSDTSNIPQSDFGISSGPHVRLRASGGRLEWRPYTWGVQLP